MQNCITILRIIEQADTLYLCNKYVYKHNA